MNSDQIKSGARMMLGWLFAGVVGVWLKAHGFPIDDGAITVFAAVLAGGVQLVWNWWEHSHAGQAQAAARSIEATPNDTSVTGPVAQALQDAGVLITPQAITQTN